MKPSIVIVFVMISTSLCWAQSKQYVPTPPRNILGTIANSMADKTPCGHKGKVARQAMDHRLQGRPEKDAHEHLDKDDDDAPQIVEDAYRGPAPKDVDDVGNYELKVNTKCAEDTGVFPKTH